MKRKGSLYYYYPAAKRLAWAGAKAAASYAGKKTGEYLKAKARNQATGDRGSSTFVTTQRDVKTIRGGKKYNRKAALKNKKFRARIQKALAPNQSLLVYSEVYSAIQTSYIALAGPITSVTQLQSLFTVSDGHFTMNSGHLVSVLRDTPYLLETYRNLTGSTADAQLTTGAMAAASINNFKLRIHMMTMEISLSNTLATTTQIVDVYECVAAKDIADANYAFPRAAWVSQLAANYGAVDAAPVVRKALVTDSGQTPYDCPGFGNWWKVLKKSRILLNGGSTSEFKVFIKGQNAIGDASNTLYAVKGKTKGVIIVAGVGDNTGAAAGGTSIRAAVQKTWHFRYPTELNELPQRPINAVQFF